MDIKTYLIAAIVAFFSIAAHATEKEKIPPLIPVERFAALSSMEQMELSPDGEYVAYIGPYKGRKHAFIHPKKDRSNIRIIPPIEDADIGWVKWINNDRLLVSYKYTMNSWGDKYSGSALFSAEKLLKDKFVNMARPNRNERKMGYKTSLSQFKDDVIDFLPEDPEHFILSLDDDRNGYDHIRKVNVNTGRYSTLYNGARGIQNWMIDQQHMPRYGWGFHKNKKRVVYKDPDSGKRKDLAETDWYQNKNIRPIEFTDDPRIAYALMPNEEGRKILIKFNIPEGKIVEIVFEHDSVDVSGLAYDPETGNIVGYNYYEDMPRTHFINATYKRLFEKLQSWLPSGSHSVIGRNSAKKIYLIKHYSDKDKGTLYVLDLINKTFAPLGSTMPLIPDQMASVKQHDIIVRDGLIIPTYVTYPKGRNSKNLPTIVLPHGGPHARDSASFDYWAQFLANRGYLVIQPNFRGSTGYGSKFVEMGHNQWGGKMQDDVTDVTKWAIEQGITDPERLCIGGGSYGGYAALMGAVKEPDLYKCAISINGVANIPAIKTFDRKFIGGKLGIKKITPKDKSDKDISPHHRAGEIKIPVLIIHAKDDPVVPYKQARNMYKKLKRLKKPVEFVSIKSGDHFLDTSKARITTLNAMEKFLQKQIGQ